MTETRKAHDEHFKYLLSTFFCEFLDAFVPALATDVDRRRVEFLDKELIWIRRRFRKTKLVDLVAKVKVKGTRGFILVHVEQQAQRDRAIAQRMFFYCAWLIDRYGLPVWPVLVGSYAKPRAPEPDSYEVVVRGKQIISFHYQVVQLNRLDWRDFLKHRNPAATALMVRMNIAPADRVRLKVEILRLLLTMRLRPKKKELISSFVETYLKLTAKEELQSRAEISKLPAGDQEEVMRMLLLGERAGLRKGRQDGRLEMLREDILEILEARFKHVPYDVRETVKTIRTETRLRKVLRRAAVADDLEAFASRL